jgi:hypothetical protein
MEHINEIGVPLAKYQGVYVCCESYNPKVRGTGKKGINTGGECTYASGVDRGPSQTKWIEPVQAALACTWGGCQFHGKSSLTR